MDGFSVLNKSVISTDTSAMKNEPALLSLIDANPHPQLQTDDNGVILYANKAAIRLLDATNTKVGDHIPVQWLEWFYEAQADGSGRKKIRDADTWYLFQADFDASNHVVNIYVLDISERVYLENKIDVLKDNDRLTQLPSRPVFKEQLSQLIVKDHANKVHTVLIVIDVDHFKEYNYRFGYHIGDLLLQLVGERISTFAADNTLVSRVSGSEFVMAISGVKPENISELEHTIIQLKEHLLLPFVAKGHRLTITTTMGVAIASPDCADVDKLIKKAQLALYQAKKECRSKHYFYNAGMHVAFDTKYKIQEELKFAVKRNQLELYFEPRVNLDGLTIQGGEALLRWNHPELGLIMPSYFIPLAEDSGLIVEIGDWVITQVCVQIHQWRTEGLTSVEISVNLSALQLKGQHLSELFADLNDRYPGILSNLELEITEGVLLHDFINIAKLLAELRRYGIHFSIDDFGTGYSSLSYLGQLAVDKIKIDKHFVHTLLATRDNEIIINTIIELGHRLQLKVCAEGIETYKQLEYLQQRKCDQAQGYFFSKPVVASTFNKFLEKGLLEDIALY